VTTGQILELLGGIALGVGGGLLWRRGDTQGGVFLAIIAALVIMHALDLFKYRPSQGEIDRQQLQGSGQ
jgi:hypothetical protein